MVYRRWRRRTRHDLGSPSVTTAHGGTTRRWDEAYIILLFAGIVIVYSFYSPGTAPIDIIFHVFDGLRLRIQLLLSFLDAGPFALPVLPGWVFMSSGPSRGGELADADESATIYDRRISARRRRVADAGS